MADHRQSRRPADTAYKQQRLKAWQPVLAPKVVLPAYFLVGLVFIPIAIALHVANNKVTELVFDYTNCKYGGASAPPITSWTWDAASSNCTITFQIPSSFQPPVFMYYRLTNFYQNHRKYVKSFDAGQLVGNAAPLSSTGCAPLANPPAGTVISLNGTGLTANANAMYYPCGLISNSMFSGNAMEPQPAFISIWLIVFDHTTDEISGLTCASSDCSTGATYDFGETGISWPSDKDRFQPTKWATTLSESDLAATLVPPPMWQTAWPKWANGYNSTNLPNLNTWERYQVWMRTAALPTFRKPWGKNSDKVLGPGTWTITIHDTFDVNKFGGTKGIAISTASLLGGKNSFLASSYALVGCVCWILGMAFLARHMVKPR
ncbi:hypothetical protein HKX48_005700 [Thoreauomyces humboldtii]|nr:hypothetical protein HKX48_005700 [Thoreauomyces humboldtii]